MSVPSPKPEDTVPNNLLTNRYQCPNINMTKCKEYFQRNNFF